MKSAILLIVEVIFAFAEVLHQEKRRNASLKTEDERCSIVAMHDVR